MEAPADSLVLSELAKLVAHKLLTWLPAKIMSKGQLVRKYQDLFEEALIILRSKYGNHVNSGLLSDLLAHHFEEERIHEFIIKNYGHKLDNLNLLSILDREVQSIVDSVDFESPELEELEFDNIEKAQVKEKGGVWRIHKYDDDDFPSSPHAHEASNNLKLHLGTGEIFRKRQLLKKLNKKEFSRLCQKIEKKGIDLTHLKQ